MKNQTAKTPKGKDQAGNWRAESWLRMLPILVMLALLTASAGAPAHQVNQCVDGRTVSYQTTPCSAGQPAKQWGFAAPAAAPPAAGASSRPARTVATAGPSPVRLRKQRATPAYRAARIHAPGAGDRAPAGDGSCESMRAQRAAAYEKVGLKRGFALSSHWDNKVHQACR